MRHWGTATSFNMAVFLNFINIQVSWNRSETENVRACCLWFAKRKVFFIFIFYIFFGPNLRLNVCEKLAISPKMFIINNTVTITIIIIIITTIINIMSFVTVFAIVLFVRQRGANHAPEASVTQVNNSVHTLSTFLRIRTDPSMHIFWVSFTVALPDTSLIFLTTCHNI